MTDRDAVLVGAVLQVAVLLACGGTGRSFFRAFPRLGAALLVSLGFVGGSVAGGLVDGSRHVRAAHGGLCSAIGGIVFASWLYYTLLADVYFGAFYGLAYAIATIGILPAFVAQYNDLLPVAFGVGGILVYALEGVLAGALIPPEWIEPPPFYPS